MKEYNPQELEKEILKFWSEKKIYKKLKDKVKNEKKFYFLDGPPYTSGEPGPHHLWNRTLKDMIRRHLLMKRMNVWDQPGFDMHGLPIETRIEKEHNLKSRKEIKEFGVDKFLKKCKEFAFGSFNALKDGFIRLGEWANWEDPYQTIKDDYIEGVWWSFKKAWDKSLLYEGKKSIHWCPRCGTALARNYEIEYKNITENSIFLKFPLKEENKYLIIWTTTPWTIPCNLGVMVDPKINYAQVKVDDEEWIIAEDLTDKLMSGWLKDYKIIKTFKGKDLEGLEYEHPLEEEIPKQKEFNQKWAHKVILSEEYVNLESGTGLVHMAPGCGPEDFEVGKKHDLPAFNPLNENGVFGKEGGKYDGFKARKDDPKIVKDLKEKRLLVSESSISHEYPHCERCGTAVVFRATDQWFFQVTEFKEKMLKENEKIKWVPKWSGNKRFKNWLKNVRDWCITRQRYWGTPFPLWKCDKCDKKILVGSREELKEKSGQSPKELHKPYVDKIEWDCKCGGKFKRVPDVIDVWIDSACAPFASMGYPHNKKPFESFWPVDLIIESQDQIRGWFYSLMAIGVLCFNRAPYRSVFMHGWMRDKKGRGLSKRLENYDPAKDIFKKFGADPYRLYSLKSSKAGEDLIYDRRKIKEAYRNLNVLWNLHQYIIRYSTNFEVNPFRDELNKRDLKESEKWLLSKYEKLREEVTKDLEERKLWEPSKKVEEFFLEDISRWYIQLIRRRLVLEEEKKEILSVLSKVYLGTLKLLAPTTPFITEKIYQNFKELFELKEESIHHFKWPKKEFERNKGLEEMMERAKKITSSILSARNRAQLGLRWPLQKAIIIGEYDETVDKLRELLLEQTNLKEIEVKRNEPEFITKKVIPKMGKLGAEYKEKVIEIKKELASISEEELSNVLESKGELELTLASGEEIKLKREDFIFEKELPPNWVKGGEEVKTYLSIHRKKELIEEGYSREIMRRIQGLRKKRGLKRKDRIKVILKGETKIKKAVLKYKEEIKKITGCIKLDFTKEKEKIDEQEESEEFNINKESVRIGISQVK